MHIRKSFFLLFGFASALVATAQITHPSFRYSSRDSAITYASRRYEVHSFLRNLLMGKNYRPQWQQLVTLPVLRLSETGFRIETLGGGMQTKSLKLIDVQGRSWALRSVDKDVTGALPSALQHTFFQGLSQDHISASTPYGAPVIGALASSANIMAAQPTIFFVADDTALGPYRSLFANTVAMLEQRDVGFAETEETATVVQKLQRDSGYVVNQKALLCARLLDMLVADWDRHHDNWRWGLYDSAGLHVYQAIPRDRDWAFYQSHGLVPRLVKLAQMPFLINFRKKPGHITQLSYKARELDRMFLNELDKADWQQAIAQFQNALTDDAIELAVKKLPATVFASDGAAFIEKLKSRRDLLLKPVLKYYTNLAKVVQIDGSAGSEVFWIKPAAGGFLLQIYRNQPSKNNTLQKIYERRFLRAETYRVVINGLGGNDRFIIDKNVTTTIRLKLNGGTGNNRYDLQGDLRIDVHDDSTNNNMTTGENSKLVLH